MIMFAHDGTEHSGEELHLMATNIPIIDIFVFASVLFFVITLATLVAYKDKASPKNK